MANPNLVCERIRPDGAESQYLGEGILCAFGSDTTSGRQSYLDGPDGDCKHFNVCAFIHFTHVICNLLDVWLLRWATEVVTVIVRVVNR